MSNPSMQALRVLGVPQELHEDLEVVRARACQQAGVAPQDLTSMRLAQRSLDARRSRGILRFVCHVDLFLRNPRSTQVMQRALRSGKIRPIPQVQELTLDLPPNAKPPKHAVVVGTGPAGLFAALTLARNGAGVTLIDRGESLESRHKKLVPFHRGGELDLNTNLLFGEGGAGTYSDGKLYTRVQDPFEPAILAELVKAGAPPEILYDGRAHIGTDRLHRILPKLRESLDECGAQVLWSTRLLGLIQKTGSGREQVITGLRTTRGDMPCDALFLALGHSARDTVEALHAEGLALESKPFQFGVRVEHPQELINEGRFGDHPMANTLGAASYNVALKGSDGYSGAHSFCMCPGGKIVASISEPGLLCTNGMSNSTHSSPFANAAVVTTVEPQDYAHYGSGPMAGLAFQRHFERLFFEAGGGDYAAPGQRVSDFLERRDSSDLKRTSYTFGVRPGRIDRLLPETIRLALSRGLHRFDKMIPGFAGEQGQLVGVESRSSSPLRMPRDRATFLAQGFENCYPIGEGAGFAGGIMSAAIDGARAAQVRLTHGVGLQDH